MSHLIENFDATFSIPGEDSALSYFEIYQYLHPVYPPKVNCRLLLMINLFTDFEYLKHT